MTSKQVSTTAQSRSWVFTANNPTNVLVFDAEEVTYAVYQAEIAPETGTEHYQGLIHFHRKKRMNGVITLLQKFGYAQKAHVEIAKSMKDARVYCMKEESRKPDTLPIEFGVWNDAEMGQGSRTDLVEIKGLLDNGKRVAEIADSHFSQWLRYRTGFQEYKRLKTAPRNWKTKVVFIYGPTGTGKSRWAFEQAPDAFVKSKGKWWDDYESHSDIILDDLDGSWFPVSDLKRLLDRYEYRVEVKGSHIQLVPKTIYITSNYVPWEWYQTSIDTDPVIRRIDEWWFYKSVEEHIKCADYEDFRSRVYGL